MGLSKEKMEHIEFLLDRAGNDQLDFLRKRIDRKLKEREENLKQQRFGSLNNFDWME